MDNPSRSERTRIAVISAALAIIAREGAGHLTLDAIAKESGISKGGLLHQFPNKRAVLAALLEHQTAFFTSFLAQFLDAHGADFIQPRLAAEIATTREIIKTPNSLAFAVLAAAAQDPSFMAVIRHGEIETIAAIRAEAAAPDIAVQHWFTARGVAFSMLLGLCPLSPDEREGVFQRLLDTIRRPPQAEPVPVEDTPAQARTPRRRKTKA